MPYLDSLKGSYPIELSIYHEYSFVQWFPLATDDLVEPFLGSTMMRLSRERPWVRPIKMGLDSVLGLVVKPPRVFIFHTSRCGSTLLGNILKSVRGSVVISEPSPLAAIADTPLETGRWPNGAQGVEALRDEVITGVISSFTQMPATFHFIKCSGRVTRLLPVIQQLYPSTPCIFIYRDPLEVVQSNIATPPSWVRFLRDPELAAPIFGWPADEIKGFSREVFFARVYARICDIAIKNPHKNLLLINYKQLSEDLVPKILRHLAITPELVDQQVLHKAFATYSKDANQARAFTNDAQQKQADASEAVREAVAAFAAEPYAQLEALRTNVK